MQWAVSESQTSPTANMLSSLLTRATLPPHTNSTVEASIPQSSLEMGSYQPAFSSSLRRKARIFGTVQEDSGDPVPSRPGQAVSKRHHMAVRAECSLIKGDKRRLHGQLRDSASLPPGKYVRLCHWNALVCATEAVIPRDAVFNRCRAAWQDWTWSTRPHATPARRIPAKLSPSPLPPANRYR